MNEEAYARQVVTALDDSLTRMRPEVVRKLQSAREQACELASERGGVHRYRPSHTLALVDWLRQHRVGAVGVLLAMLLALGAMVWQNLGSGSAGNDDTADIDASLLTGDLPVNAYLDNHLSKWTSNDSGG